MIEELPSTSVSEIARRLVSMRQESGVAALGRVLTLVISAERSVDEGAIRAANDASNEHPMRVIVLIVDQDDPRARLDAEIRVGADAGASEVVVLRAYGDAASGVESLVTGLLLPDAPVFVWWPGSAPARPGADPLGRIAQRRITDSDANGNALAPLIAGYSAGDTDLAWTRITRWREYLAAVLDQPPFEAISSVEVVGCSGGASCELLAAWLELSLRVPTRLILRDRCVRPDGVHSVTLKRRSGDAVLVADSSSRAVLRQPGQPDHEIVLPTRTASECLAEELRGLDEDKMYGRVLDHLGRAANDSDSDKHSDKHSDKRRNT